MHLERYAKGKIYNCRFMLNYGMKTNVSNHISMTSQKTASFIPRQSCLLNEAKRASILQASRSFVMGMVDAALRMSCRVG